MACLIPKSGKGITCHEKEFCQCDIESLEAENAKLKTRIAELEAKNAKLLEALDWIANHPGYASLDRDFGPFKKDIIDDRNERILKARAALDGAGRE